MLSDLKDCTLCAGWSESALASVGRIVHAREYTPHAVIFKQGEAANGAFVLVTGEAEVVRLLPGGGELLLASLAAGDIVGELGLISDIPRSATVRARGVVRGLVFDRQRYQGALQFRDPAVLALSRVILLRIADLARRMMTQLSGNTLALGALPQARDVAPPAPTAVEAPLFDYPRFLPLLRCFRPFTNLHWQPLLATLTPASLRIGERLNAAGAAADGIIFVVRGALEAIGAELIDARPVHIIGPGFISGLPAALDGKPHPLTVLAREQSVVLRLPQAEFNNLLAREDEVGVAAHEAISDALAECLVRLNSRLAQMTGIQRAQDLLGTVQSRTE